MRWDKNVPLNVDSKCCTRQNPRMLIMILGKDTCIIDSRIWIVAPVVRLGKK